MSLKPLVTHPKKRHEKNRNLCKKKSLQVFQNKATSGIADIVMLMYSNVGLLVRRQFAIGWCCDWAIRSRFSAVFVSPRENSTSHYMQRIQAAQYGHRNVSLMQSCQFGYQNPGITVNILLMLFLLVHEHKTVYLPPLYLLHFPTPYPLFVFYQKVEWALPVKLQNG
jgi:hypothetical protein